MICETLSPLICGGTQSDATFSAMVGCAMIMVLVHVRAPDADVLETAVGKLQQLTDRIGGWKRFSGAGRTMGSDQLTPQDASKFHDRVIIE